MNIASARDHNIRVKTAMVNIKHTHTHTFGLQDQMCYIFVPCKPRMCSVGIAFHKSMLINKIILK
jgi:hypothetical protein